MSNVTCEIDCRRNPEPIPRCAKLAPRLVAKPWGVNVLPQPFVSEEHERIGEVWFEPDPACPGVLVKYIFTSEALSVQVHPSDAQASAAGLVSAGKEECWLVLTAEPGAKLGVGLRAPLDAASLRAAALDGSIEELLEWYTVEAGDFFYIPAGTIHAIGAGVSLLEIQQDSDVTYRLYDYGRPRELHLDAAIAVARREPHDPSLRRRLLEQGAFTLVEGPRFRLDQIDREPSAQICALYEGYLLVVPLDGGAIIDGEFVSVGECGLARSLAEVSFAGRCLITQSI